MSTILEQEARLFILQQLAEERDGRGTALRLQPALRDLLAINRPREWVETQFVWLRDMGAVLLRAGGALPIYEITEVGRAHLNGDAPIIGVKRRES